MSDQRYITMSRLGQHGRFANCIFQKMFLETYARQHDLIVQHAPWIGEQLFGHKPSPVRVKLPAYVEPLHKHGQPFRQPGGEIIDHDFRGYGQHHTSYYEPHYKFLRDLFRPTLEIRHRMRHATDGLLWAGANVSSPPRTAVGIHLRRGDYGRFAFYNTPVEWYLEWLRRNWSSLDNPVLFVASEDLALVGEFSDYNPQTAESLGVNLRAEPMPTATYLKYDLDHPEPHLFDFFPDWYLLSQCDYLLIPNSTFSFAAAMFSQRLKRCFRSDLPTQRFVEIDPWDSDPMTGDLAEDWRHVPGVCMITNPQWTRQENRVRVRELGGT